MLEINTYYDVLGLCFMVGLGIAVGFSLGKDVTYSTLDFIQSGLDYIFEKKLKLFVQWLRFEWDCANRDLEKKE